MKNNFNTNILLIASVLLVAATIACTKTKKDAFKDYMKGGEIVYPGRVDTVIVHAGYKKAQLSVVLGNDPLVNKVRVFWNSMLDSVDATIDHTKDTVNILVPDLTAGNYNFVVYAFDSAGHKSVDVNASGTVYGDDYVASLTNRTLKSVQQSKDGLQLTLTWGEAASGELGTEVNYISADGSNRKLIIPSVDGATILPDYKEKSKLTYKSLYKPDSTAFETFSANAVEVLLPAFEKQFDKSKFQLVTLPTDVRDGGYWWLQQYMWDEKYNPPGFATQSQIPCWFTLDAGISASLSKFKLWQANDRLYEKESVKTFELYGSNAPASDGSWESWTKIGAYTSVKPSGLPLGQVIATDVEYAKAGEEFAVPESTPKFRYYRFKLLSNWGNSNFMTIEEITFFTHDR